MAIINGGIGNDTLNGTTGDDNIYDGGGGSDVLNGGDGNDTLRVTGGVDTVDGGAGTDLLNINWSDLTVAAWTSYGLYANGGGAWYGNYHADDGRDVGFNLIERFIIQSGSGNDSLNTATGDDSIFSAGGDDQINVGSGNDTANGGSGIDRISADLSGATAGSHWNLAANTYSNSAGYGSFTNFEWFGGVTGTGYDDSFQSMELARNDTVYGGAGNDTFTARLGNDSFDGGSGEDDRLIVDWATDTVGGYVSYGIYNNDANSYYGTYSNGVDRSINFDHIEHFTFLGGSGNDAINTGIGNDSMSMGAGDDFANVGRGENTVDGGSGTDRLGIDFSQAGTAINLNLNLTGEQLLAGPGSITHIEWLNVLIGSDFGDTVVTIDAALNDSISGGAGNDTVTVANGADTVYGGADVDRLVVDWTTATGDSWVSYGLYTNDPDSYYGTYTNGDGRSVNFDNIEHFTFIGGTGNDAITTGVGDDIMSMGDGDDFANVSTGTNQVDGGSGIDRLGINFSGATGPVLLDLTQSGQQLLSGPGSVTGIEWVNQLIGSDHDDAIITRNLDLNDSFNGGAGNDSFTSRHGDDTFNGGGGVDDADRLIVDWSTSSENSWVSYGLYTNDSNSYYGTYTNGTRSSVNFDNIEHFTFIGGSGNDEINTGVGNDSLSMGGGNDFANVSTGTNTVAGGSGTDRLGINYSEAGSGIHLDLTQSGAQLLSGPGAVQGFEWTSTLVGSAHADTVITTNLALDDVISAGDGNDTITVRNGADTVDGGAGSDRLVINWSSATANAQVSYGIYENAPGTYYGTYSDGAGRSVNFDHIEHFSFTGGSGNDAINTGNGDDIMSMGAGDDFANVGRGTNQVNGGSGVDRLGINYADAAGPISLDLNSTGAQLLTGPGSVSGFEWVHQLIGSAYGDTLDTTDLVLNDSFSGGDGNDVMTVRNGNDTFYGGAGTDTLIIDWSSATGSTYVSYGPYLNAPGSYYGTYSNTDGRSVNFDNIERIWFASGNSDDTLQGNSGDDSLIANGGNDSLLGYDGNDTLNGGQGNDTLDGGNGSDTATYVGDPAGVLVDLENQTATDGWGTTDTLVSIENATGSNYADTLLGSTGDNVLIGGTGFDSLNGGDGNDTLQGDGGNDTLDGGAGDDSMAGGLGDDIYFVDSAADLVSEQSGGGVDTVRTTLNSAGIASYGNVEALAFVGTGDATLSGGLNADSLTGGIGNDVLSGFGSNDTINGGAGNDTLNGNAGDDWLDGGANADVMNGGGGNDTFIVNHAGDVVVELAGQGHDEIRTSLNTFSLGSAANVEVLTFTGSGDASLSGAAGADLVTGGAGNDTLNGGGDNDTLQGAAGNDLLLGNAGNDWLDGGSGNDVMFGGGDDDTYIIDSVDDRAVELAGQGFDEVHTSLTFTNMWSFANNIEAITYTGAGNATLVGALADNAITGNTGNDSLRGFGGNDSVNGGDGNDTLTGDNGNDVLDGGAGNDLMFGGNDADTLIGGAGRDFMTGAAGSDVFQFADGDFSGSTTTNSDRIEDFVQGQDLIDLSLVDAVAGGGDNAFTFIGTAGFHHVAGELRYEFTPVSTMIYGDTDGDGTTDFAIKLAGLVNLTAGDFIL